MARPNFADPLPLIFLDNIIGEPLPPIDWDIEPLLAHGDRLVVFGEFGSMKSWLLLDLGLHLAAGWPWLGKFRVPAARRVLYLDEEMNERTLRRRMRRLALGASSTFTIEGIPFAALSRMGMRFDASGADKLLTALETTAFDPDVIIVESLRRVMGGAEKEAQDVSAFWRNVEPILHAGKTLVITHHMRKPRSKRDQAYRDRASGSTDILAGADSAYAVERLGKDRVVIQCVKSRETEEPGPIFVALAADNDDGPAQMVCCEQTAAGSPGIGKLEEGIRLATAFLKEKGGVARTGEVTARLTEFGVAQRTAERILPILVERGRLQRLSHGCWQLTEGAG